MSHYDDRAGVPIWFTVVKDESINFQLACYRIVKCIKATDLDIDRLCKEYAINYNDSSQVRNRFMFFHREPDETPLKEKG